MSGDRWRDEGGPWGEEEEAAPTNVDVRVGLGVSDIDGSPVFV